MASTIIPNAAPTTAIPQTPGAPPNVIIPGTNIPVPTGGGVEQLLKVPAPFRTQSPPWYTPTGTVWSQMGCAVPQPGTQIQTNNRVIWDFVNFCGRALFDVLWTYNADRLTTTWPSYNCLWEMYQLLINGRNRLVAKTTPDASTPLVPGKTGSAPKMFQAFPVPFYGQLGCVNQYIGEFAETIMRMCTDGMSHQDNARDWYISQNFFQTVYPYVQYLMVDMATKFFGEDPVKAAAQAYVIPTTDWTAYSPTTNSVSFERTSATPPLNYVGPTPADLQNIMALTYEDVIPFLQPWPDSQFVMTSGGIWGNSSSPAIDSTANAGANAVGNVQAGAPNLAATANPSIFVSSGPPVASAS